MLVTIEEKISEYEDKEMEAILCKIKDPQK